MNNKERLYAYEAARIISEITTNKEMWTAFLKTMARNYTFTYPEQVLIYAQRPNATLCKEFDDWKDEKLRYVKRGSKGIALFVPNRDRPKLRYVFDVADTGSRRNSKELNELWSIKDKYRQPIQNALEKTFGVISKGTMEMQIEDVVTHLTDEYWSDHGKEFADIVENSLLEEYDEINLKMAFKQAVTISATYGLYTRCVEYPDAYFEQEDFLSVFEFNTKQTVNALGTAVNSISSEILKEIELTIQQFEQSKNIERSNDYEYERNDLHSSGRIHDSQHYVEGTGSEGTREIWKNETNILAGEQTNDLQRHDLERNIISTPLGDSRNSDKENGINDGTVIENTPSTGQKEQSNGVGSTHEHTKRTSRRSHQSGTNLQLSLLDFLSEQEQIEFIDKVESKETKPFAFSFTDEEINHVLIYGSNTDNAHSLVATEFMKQKSVNEISQFLEKIYHGGFGIRENNHNVVAWYDFDGIHLSKGLSAIYEKSAHIISWEDAANRIQLLLDKGEYATNVELIEAPQLERKLLAEKIWYLYHDFSDVAKEKDYLTSLNDFKNNGFPKETEYLIEQLKNNDFRLKLTNEFVQFINDYKENHELLRFSYHEPETILKGLKDLELPRIEFYSEMMERPAIKFFITDDEINEDITQGSGISGGKLRIYDYFTENHSAKDKIDFLKNEYGIGGHSHALSSAKGSGQDHNAKGLHYNKKGCNDVNLTWNQVVTRIDDLILHDRYLNVEEKSQIEDEVYAVDGVDQEVKEVEIDTNDEHIDVEVIPDLDTKQDDNKENIQHYQFYDKFDFEDENFIEAFVESRDNNYDLESFEPEPELDYGLGDKVYIDDTLFEITGLSDNAVQLLDPTLVYPVYRVENKSNFERTLKYDERNNHNKADKVIPAVNFQITDEHLGEGGPKQKYTRNIAAIKLLYELEENNRNATQEEQEVLSQYVGWGGLADAFDNNKSSWQKEYHELKELLPEREYEMARSSTLNAHYTSPIVIQAVYDAVEQIGFKTGNILEPAMGVGNFFGMMPDSMRNSQLFGVELDSISGRIAKKLYPNASITIDGFETTKQRDFYDLAIGNVPFGNYKVSDKPYDKLGFSIHNYFFAKALDQVRPGGIVAFVTSKYTMDQQSPDVRKYLAQRAELLGAIRLPNTAFKANAGAEVVSDIIFLQKREHQIDIEPDWVHLGQTDDGHVINSYFVEHPEMIVGELATQTNQYGKDESTVLPNEEIELAEQLKEAVKKIKGEYKEAELSDNHEKEINETIPADPNVKNFSYTVRDGEIYFRENSVMRLCDMNEKSKNRIESMVELREIVNKLIDYQLEDYPDEDIEATQNQLGLYYDEFVSEFGLINSKANAKAFSEDSSYYLLCSLENLDENGILESKADMFTKRTIRPEVHVTSVDTSSEALAISIGERGCVDLTYMAELLGTPTNYDRIFEELHGVIFKDPLGSTELEKDWQTADEYLSGNVREKLKIAKLAAKDDSRFNINVQALEKAQPKDLEASEIDVRLGATWIDKKYIQQFMEQTFDTPFYLRSVIEVDYSPLTAEWRISGKSSPSHHDVSAYVTYGTDRANAYRILEETLNLKDIRIYDTYEEDGKQKRVLNKRETTLAQQKQQAIKDAFQDWIWKDPNRRQKLVETYNEMFNSTRPREYDGSHIRFGGMNPDIKLRPHQKNAIAHVLYGGNTLLAHEVGAGKTFEMAASAMESKRLGLCQKSMFVVPNHLTLQWANEFLRLYPSAKLLVASKKDFETKNRKKFCAKIATGDYDAVIIGHSQFERIPISAERQERLLREQIDEIENALDDLKRSHGENFSIKQMEKTRKSLQTRLDKLSAQDKKDDVITFEQLGVDRLFVDESHSFKNLFLYTKMRNVAGLSTSEAQKSSDMFMKCRYMDELTDGKGVIFATGTPVSNSMTELYTVMRYLQYGTLQQKKLTHFDCWASTFGETTTAIELAPEGTGYRARTRFAKFFNLPELMNMFKEVADIKTSDQLNLPVPEAKFETIVVEPSDIQKEMVQQLSERAALVHGGSIDPSVDNMLKITSDGRKIGLDQRLMNPLLPDDENSKLNACVNNVFKIWEDGKDEKLTQLLFCDLSTPKSDGTFNVYDDIKTKLLSNGVPNEEIAFIHDADTEAKKKELFSKVRTGQVRVLLGSTQKMGAGTNVQDRLAAIHHLDVGWKPSDMTQRNGRGIRQGNMNKEIKIFQYVTEGTFDAYLYQTLENKQKFISQIMTSKSPVRSCDDVDEQALSYAEIKALCAGNPLIKEKMDLDIDVARLKVLKGDYQTKQYRLEDKLLEYYPLEIEKHKGLIKGLETDIQTVSKHPLPKDNFIGMTINDRFYSEKEIAGEAILAACKSYKGTDGVSIGNYRGFKIELNFDALRQEFELILKGRMSHHVYLGNVALGNITRIDNALANIPNRLEKTHTKLENLYNQQEAAKIEVGKPFPQEVELSQKMARLAELDAALNMDEKELPEEENKDEKTSVLKDLKNRSESITPHSSKNEREVEL